MKLHLPNSLRAVLLALLAVPAATTLTTGALYGVATAALIAGQQAEATTITFNGGLLNDFADGSLLGDKTFDQENDSIIITGDTQLFLGANISTNTIQVTNEAELSLTGQGHTFQNTLIEVRSDSVLTLNDKALDNTTIVRGNNGAVCINWGTAGGSLATQLTNFQGTLLINNSSYTLSNGESYGQLTMTGGSTLTADTNTYSGPVTFSAQNTISTSGASNFSGGLTGFGQLTKEGTGSWVLTATNSYYTGDLDIKAGRVRLGSTTSGSNSQAAENSILFNNITINANTFLEGSHSGLGADSTTLTLKGGTIEINGMRAIRAEQLGLYGTTIAQYKALDVTTSGRIAYTAGGEQRFGTLSSTNESALTLAYGTAAGVIRFDQVENYHGTITASGGTDATRQFILGNVHQTAGNKLTVSGVITSGSDITKTGAGELVLQGGLDIDNTLAIEEGTVTVGTSLQADSIKLTGGELNTTSDTATQAGDLSLSNGSSITAEGNITVSHGLTLTGTDSNLTLNGNNRSLSAGSISLTNGTSLAMANSGGTIQCAEKFTISQSSLSMGNNSSLTAGQLTIQSNSGLSMGNNSSIKADQLLLNGSSLSMGNDSALTVGQLDLSNGNNNLSTTSLTVSKLLTMNYSGTVSYTDLTLEDGVVLSYSGAGSKQIQLDDKVYRNSGTVSFIFIDASTLNEAQLRQGIALDDLGIDTLFADKIYLSGWDFNVTNNVLTATRSSNSGSWDTAWGSTVLATAPNTLRDVTWTTAGAFEPGLYNGQFNIDNYFTAAKLTGNGDGTCSVVGGCWATANQYPAGGTTERPVWITTAGGHFTLIAGGSLNDPTPTALTTAPWNQKGDTHIQINSGTTVGTVIGGHFKDNGNPTMEGDSYISIEGQITGSVFGSSVHTGYSSTHVGEAVNTANTLTQTGDTYIYLYTRLGTNTTTVFQDPTIVNSGALEQEIAAHAIAGGSLSYYGGQASRLNGDSTIVVDFGSPSSSGSMVKHIVGGHVGPGSHTQTGNTSITIRNSATTSFTGNIIGGHSGSGASISYGNTSIAMAALGSSTFSGSIVGGSAGGSSTQTGDSSISLTNASSASFSGDIIGGSSDGTSRQMGNSSISLSHLGTSTFNGAVIGGSSGLTLEQTGNSAITITGSSSARFNAEIIGNQRLSSGVSHTGRLDGNSKVDIQGGTFTDKVIGGNLIIASTQLTSSNTEITGSTNINIANGTFSNTVLGGSYYDNSSRTFSTVVEKLGAVNIELTGGTYAGSTSLIGGSSITDSHTSTAATATAIGIGDINITLSSVTVNGEILGGSQIGRNTNNGYAQVRQGAINLSLGQGVYNGNIYAAGEQVSGTTTTILTASTNVSLSRSARLGKPITISGGYKGGAATIGSIVTGNRILTFAEAGTYTNLSNATFHEFNVVDVTDAKGYVTLNQNLNYLDANVTKIGEGTLELTKTNSVSHLTVLDGTLKLAASSSKTSSFDTLTIAQGGTLDISNQLCGINGTVMLDGGSTLKVLGAAQKAAAMAGATNTSTLVWGGTVDNKVNLELASALTTDDGEYYIELFSGLTRADISGLDLREIYGVGYATEASNYLTSSALDLSSAYLLLENDGTLVLTSLLKTAVYWEGPDNGTWDINTTANWAKQDGTAADTTFQNTYRSVFSKDAGEAAGAEHIKVVQDVTTSIMEVKDGDYIFQGDGSVTITNSLQVYSEKGESASATFENEVAFGTNAALIVGSECEATFSNDIILDSLSNSGTVTVDGDLTLKNGVSSGGTVNVSNGDLKLGGSSSFTQLTAGNVTGNQGNTLQLGGQSEILSLDGGTLSVRENGSVSITTTGKTSLTALQGEGGLSTAGALALKEASHIGNLSTAALTVGGTLDVEGILVTDSISFSQLTLSSERSFVQVGSLAALTPNGSVDVQVDASMVTNQILATGTDYYLVRFDKGDIDNVFLNGGTDELTFDNARYQYTISRLKDGVTVTSEVAHEYDFSTPNGTAGADILNNVFKDGALLQQHPEGDVVNAIRALDELVIRNKAQEADTLAAAVAGSSIPALGMAMASDIQRQLKAIRNRTTTMGVNECVYNEDMPYFNAWINAEGNHHELEDDGTASGYKLDSWGGTVGFDVDATPNLTFGIALTALYGTYKSQAPDAAEGDMDTQYVTVFARYAARSWVHTFVASIGRSDITLDRTVTHAYGSYTATGDTTGLGFGLMYEVGKVFAVNEEATACIQPVLNFTLAHASISGYSESGSDAALAAGDTDVTTFTIGAGARFQAAGGENIYNRTSIFEARALFKVDAGDRKGETDVAFAGLPGCTATVESAEAGAVGVELGAGVTIPIGAESDAVFADVSAELRSGYTSVNGTIGYRLNF